MRAAAERGRTAVVECLIEAGAGSDGVTESLNAEIARIKLGGRGRVCLVGVDVGDENLKLEVEPFWNNQVFVMWDRAFFFVPPLDGEVSSDMCGNFFDVFSRKQASKLPPVNLTWHWYLFITRHMATLPECRAYIN